MYSRIVVDANTRIAPPRLARSITRCGARPCSRLSPDETSAPIGQVVAAHDDGSECPMPEVSDEPRLLEPTPDERATIVGLPRPATIRLLEPYRVSAHGNHVARGIRSAGKELLAWFLLQPEGAAADAAIEAFWPDTAPELTTKRFWRALGVGQLVPFR